jgi:hypothetical protein
MAGLSNILGINPNDTVNTDNAGAKYATFGSAGSAPITGANAQAGLGQINQGMSNINQAVGQIGSALGNADINAMKKGGAVKATKISTHKKSKKAPTW